MRALAVALALALLPGCLASDEPADGDADQAGGEPRGNAFTLPANPRWAPLPDAALPRVEHCAANVGAKFYIIGGFIVPHPVSAPSAAGNAGVIVPTNSVEIFDATTNAFSAGPQYPVTLDHCLAVAIGDTIYVVHGGGSHKIKAGGAQWTPIPNPPHSHGATGVAEEIDGKIYVTAGSGGGSAFVDVFDPATNAWSSYPEASNIPTTRNHMGGAVVDGRLYAIGGDVGGHSRNTAANEEFDPLTGQWRTRADLPVVRGSLHAFTWFGHVVVMGGQNGATNVPSFADVHAYDPATDAWTALPKMTNPRHGFAGGVYQDKVYVFAGAPQQGVSGSAKNDVLMAG